MTHSGNEAAVEGGSEQVEGAPASVGAGWTAEDLRRAGERGKQQWEESIAAARRATDEALAALTPDALGKRWAEARRRVLEAPPVARAQARGAALLLGVVSEVRARATRLEAVLERARASAAAPAGDVVGTQAA